MVIARNQSKNISTNKISIDPNNPRGLTEAQITNSPKFNQLALSIKEYGILQPLIIKSEKPKSSDYLLIDGERRFRAAKKARQTEVPVLIADSDTDGRILAYQIHMHREDWSKAAETKAIKKLISDLKEDEPSITEKEIKTKLKGITSHTSPELDDLFILSKHTDAIIEMAVSGSFNMSYLIQNEKSFIRPLKRLYPAIYDEYTESGIREILSQKALNGKIPDTRFLMDNFNVVFQNTTHKNEISKLLLDFLNTKARSIKTTLDKYKALLSPKSSKNSKKQKSNKSKRKSGKKGGRKKGIFEFEGMKVTAKAQTLKGGLRDKFESIGSSFTESETTYIAEALECLERDCFKAAATMIWAAGIDKILAYIKDNLTNFNAVSNEMFKSPAQVYKHHSKNFQKDSTSVDDIRVSSNDMQLLSYLHRKAFINTSEFNKLHANYKTRCECAHPTEITLSTNETIALFENVYKLILNNINLN